jgi:hypothetical protein
MQTSYFNNVKEMKDKNLVSIARSSPAWFKGRQYKKLAPSWKLLNDYKTNKMSYNEYIGIYTTEILQKLDVTETIKELGEDAILLCWEPSGFCHRHIVAVWIEDKMGLKVKEMD